MSVDISDTSREVWIVVDDELFSKSILFLYIFIEYKRASTLH